MQDIYAASSYPEYASSMTSSYLACHSPDSQGAPGTMGIRIAAEQRY
jgi:hypothetical protein